MLKIGDFSKETGLSVKTLRYYDEIDLFKPSITEPFTGYRYYTENQLIDIEIIKELKKLDLSLDQIKEYLKTNDIRILTRKRIELEMQINKIVNFVNNEYKNYIIVEADYNRYILNNGLFQSRCPQALEVRDGNAKYYVIENNKEAIDDFVIYNNENWITLERRKFLDDGYLDLIINFLSNKNYKYITTYIPIEEEKIVNCIANKFNNITKEIVEQAGYKYIKYKINLY